MKIVSRTALSRSAVEFDGSEEDFFSSKFALSSPVCAAVVEAHPVAARSLYFESDEINAKVAESLPGIRIKQVLGSPTLYFRSLRASAERTTCKSCGSIVVLIWAQAEVQPGRFKAILKGGLVDLAMGQ